MTTYYFAMDLEFATEEPDSLDEFDAFTDRVLNVLGATPYEPDYATVR